MTRTSIIALTAVVGSLVVAGCSRRDTTGTQRTGDYSNQPAQGTYPGIAEPGSRAEEPLPGRASGGGVDDPALRHGAGDPHARASGGGVKDPSTITTKDHYEDYVEERVDHLENMLDGFKDRGDSLTGAAKDQFDKQVDVCEQGIKNLKSSVGKLDDNNWTAMRSTIDQDLKRVESEIQKLGSSSGTTR
jgi:hypothetical protein